ncbi:MAG: TlpA family protein disulfide reductase [Planctomycetaceae bacterium]|nr:TlpA family protein disulfide reductase [Planctomycetaceae bacterium]
MKATIQITAVLCLFLFAFAAHAQQQPSAEERQRGGFPRSEVPEIHELVNFIPTDPFDTPEGQAKQREWLEQIEKYIAETKDAEKKLILFMFKYDTLQNLLAHDAATKEEFFAFAKEVKFFSNQIGIDAKQQNEALHVIHIIDSGLFNHSFGRLIESDTITDEALEQLFLLAQHMLESSKPIYEIRGGALANFGFGMGNRLFNRLTTEQRTFYIKAFNALVEEQEKHEQEWLAAGKTMDSTSILPQLQEHLAWIQLPGNAVQVPDKTLELLGEKITLTSTTLDGKPFDLNDLQGKVVLLEFWATWCLPCRHAIPELKQRYDEFHSRGFEIVGISIDKGEDREKLVALIASEQLPWIQLHDPSSEFFRKLYGTAIPYCLLLDREGKVVLLPARGERLKRKLEEMFPGVP